MAVEAGHNMNHFPSQFIPNRDFSTINSENGNMFINGGTDYRQPLNQFPVGDSNLFVNRAVDNGLTCNFSATRKRPREEMEKFSGGFLEDDILLQYQQQQSEIGRFIAQQREKVRIEVEERRNQQARMLVSAIQERMNEKLKEKDEEIQKMENLNWVLQHKLKTLFFENQFWKDLAQSNEAEAKSLRTNLEQLLAHISDDRNNAGVGDAIAEDAESKCGSNDDNAGKCLPGAGEGNRMCRKCCEREAKVLLLPCRHLCVCASCGSHLRSCPVCAAVMTASVQ
ncbi:hypothetical protein UlMin_019325, partial [Ulmus minor]